MSTAEQQQRLLEMINGYRSTALIFAAVKSGIIDALGDGKTHAADIGVIVGANVQACERILRGLCVLGIVAERNAGAFELTELGKELLPGAGSALREWALLSGAEYLPAWGGMLHSLQTGESSFEKRFGMSAWEHRSHNPSLQQAFQTWMSAKTGTVVDSILRSYDFSGLGIVGDLGGGAGELLFAILEKHPELHGLLMDLPRVADAVALPARCTAVGCDFFQSVPAGADALVLKSVLHDWPDADCAVILRNCRRALSPGGRLLVVERVAPLFARDDPATVMLDLHMLAVLGGRERSLADVEKLVCAAGFTLRSVIPTDCGFYVFEFLCELS